MFIRKGRFMKEVIDQVHVTKSFAGSKSRLYKAWVEDEQLKKWWKPMNKQLLEVENELKAGGRIAYRFANDLTIDGEYKLVEPEQKLVYTWNWKLPHDASHDGEYLLTISFSGDDERSELEVRQEDFKNIQAVKPHQDGWEAALEELRNFLVTKEVN